MQVDRDTITVKEWQEDSSVTATTRYNRKLVLGHLAKANGKETVEEVIADIIADRASVIGTSRTFMGYLREKAKNPFTGKPLKPSTIAYYRTILPNFFLSVLGEHNFSRTTFDRLVPAGDNYVSTEKKAPKLEDMSRILSLAGPRDKALLGVLSYGVRLGEALSRKMSDIEPLKEGEYARIKLAVEGTKARVKRYAFITREVLDWINAYHKIVTSEWVFPGEKTGKRRKDKTILAEHFDTARHLTKPPAYHGIKALFDRAGFRDTEDETYTSHSFRTLADTIMTKCGLDRKYINLIIGWKSKMGAESSYKDWDAIGQAFYDACGDVRLGSEVIERVVPSPEQEGKIKALEAQNKLQQQAILGLAEKAGVPIDELLKTGAIKMGKLARLSQKQLEQLDELDDGQADTETAS